MRFASQAALAILSVISVGLAVKPVQAQGRPSNSIAPTPTELTSAARLRPDRSLMLEYKQTGLAADVHYKRPSRRQGEILMIVGGAGILTGLLVDEALITIAGAAVGGYGLYVYLQASPKRRV